MSHYHLIGPELYKRELGVHNWVDDRGGKTAHGITERVAGRLGYDIDSIDRDTAILIYQSEYYDKQRLNEMPDIRIAWRMAIDGLHSGSGSVMRRLQRLCNFYSYNDIAIDGICGDKTLKAIDQLLNQLSKEADRPIDDLCAQLKGLQFAHYYQICKRDPSQEKWWRGWLNRIRHEPDWYQ